MKLQRFDGGIASRLAPQLLNINQGAVYENIDNATGVLTPVKDKLATNIKVEKYAKYFVAENKWLSSAIPIDYLEFQKVMYSTDRVTAPQKYSNGVSSNLGIARPITASVVAKVGSSTNLSGTYQYVYTYYNSTDGTESAPSKLSTEITTTNTKLSVTLPNTSIDPQVTHKRLYRVGGLATQFTLVVQLNKSTTTYTDNLTFAELDGRQLESDNYYEAPTGLKYLVESYAMLFGAVGSSLRFTPIGKPNAWPPEFEIQFDQDITGIGAIANGILVLTRFKTFIVVGTGPNTLSQQSLRGDQGCIAFESIKEVKAGMIIWASEDGLCASSGNNVVSLTKDLLGRIELTPISSAVYDEVYYCHNKDGTTLAWDYRFQPLLKWLNFGITTLAVANNDLYGSYEGLLYNLYKGATNLSIKYKSPLLTEGSFSENKTYKKVYVCSEGDIIISILINLEVVATFNLTGTATHQLQVPQQLQRGYSIQFEVSGTGTINELEYTVGPRQNG